MAENAYALQAREVKAHKLAALLAKFALTASEVADRQTEAFWQIAADGAGTTLPSEATRQRVVELLREREGK
jgi:hypothetical protein